MDIAIRRAKDRDANACGRICYDGFRPVNERFGFPPTFPSVEVATQRVEVEPRIKFVGVRPGEPFYRAECARKSGSGLQTASTWRLEHEALRRCCEHSTHERG